MSVLLNIDAGEMDSESPELWRLADVVNVACGGHAGDAGSMARVVDGIADGRTEVGAHPSYVDREGFGRRSVVVGDAELAAQLAAQCEALREVAEARGRRVVSVKPHGALYWDAATSPVVAEAVVACARRLGATVIGPARGALREAAAREGLAYWREGFADRGVRADGSLVPRGEPGALVTSAVAAVARVNELVASGQVETICVHGDTPDALAIARAVRAVLAR